MLRLGRMGITGTSVVSLGLGGIVGGNGGGGWTPPSNAIEMDTTSTSATWSPAFVSKSGGTLTWYVANSSGNLLTQQTANDPTFDLSGYAGTKTIYAESPDGWSGLSALYVYGLSLTRLDIAVATSLSTLRSYQNRLPSLDVTANVALTELLTHLQSGVNLAAIDLSNNVAIRTVDMSNGAMPQSGVDSTVASIYSARADYTYATPSLKIDGTNAAPSGTYADEDPPTTGKGMIYELVNDPESEGFNTWTVTYTSP